jgi:hypothetical protein
MIVLAEGADLAIFAPLIEAKNQQPPEADSNPSGCGSSVL